MGVGALRLTENLIGDPSWSLRRREIFKPWLHFMEGYSFQKDAILFREVMKKKDKVPEKC